MKNFINILRIKLSKFSLLEKIGIMFGAIIIFVLGIIITGFVISILFSLFILLTVVALFVAIKNKIFHRSSVNSEDEIEIIKKDGSSFVIDSSKNE